MAEEIRRASLRSEPQRTRRSCPCQPETSNASWVGNTILRVADERRSASDRGVGAARHRLYNPNVRGTEHHGLVGLSTPEDSNCRAEPGLALAPRLFSLCAGVHGAAPDGNS